MDDRLFRRSCTVGGKVQEGLLGWPVAFQVITVVVQLGNAVRIDSTQAYVLYVHDRQRAILLDWYGFREDLIQDVNKLAAC